MAFPEKAAHHLTYSFIKEVDPNKEQKELDRIEYGLALFFIALPKFIALLCLAILTNHFFNDFLLYFTVLLLSYGIVRAYAWGLHLKGDTSCFGVAFSCYLPIPSSVSFFMFP